MTKLVAAVLVFIGALITVSSSQARADWTYRTGRGSGPPPCGAFRPIVSYGPHTRCVARLISAAERLVATTQDVRTYLMVDAHSRR